MSEITSTLKELFIETAKVLKGHERRVFMARVVKNLGHGGQRQAERELGWDRTTIRKGRHELDSGIACIDNFAGRGRKRAEEHLPTLLEDIAAILSEQSQIDPTFRTQQLYTRLSVRVVREQLLADYGYDPATLPCNETLRTKINELGYRLRPVTKSRPQKKSLKPMPSSRNSRRSMKPLPRRSILCASRSMPKRACPSACSRAAGKAA